MDVAIRMAANAEIKAVAAMKEAEVAWRTRVIKVAEALKLQQQG